MVSRQVFVVKIFLICCALEVFHSKMEEIRVMCYKKKKNTTIYWVPGCTGCFTCFPNPHMILILLTILGPSFSSALRRLGLAGAAPGACILGNESVLPKLPPSALHFPHWLPLNLNNEEKSSTTGPSAPPQRLTEHLLCPGDSKTHTHSLCLRI